uniref:Uncharacterized protein n=1 Tax=Trypanosoma vivax (strain Y486) TaxID=1055687 RepID=G0U0D1_TRYVY|nr:hypothetical protein, unlikely [Trypanosoma vivax Y486]
MANERGRRESACRPAPAVPFAMPAAEARFHAKSRRRGSRQRKCRSKRPEHFDLCNALSTSDAPHTSASECALPFFIIFISAALPIKMCRFLGVASANELSACDAACASPCEMQRGSQSHAPPATHNSPLSLNRSAPHPYMDASAPNAAEVGRCLRGTTGLFSNKALSQRLPCLTACAGRPEAPLSCKSALPGSEGIRHTAFRKKQCSKRGPRARDTHCPWRKAFHFHHRESSQWRRPPELPYRFLA